jgi:hypothetical protein
MRDSLIKNKIIGINQMSYFTKSQKNKTKLKHSKIFNNLNAKFSSKVRKTKEKILNILFKKNIIGYRAHSYFREIRQSKLLI